MLFLWLAWLDQDVELLLWCNLAEGKLHYPNEADADDNLWNYLCHLNLSEINHQIASSNYATEATMDYLQHLKNGSRYLCPLETIEEPIDPNNYVSQLGFISPEIIAETFKNTTQLATNVLRLPLKKHFKSRYPALNWPRLREKYATDTFFSSVKGIGGQWCAQVFVGCKSLYGVVYGMATESQGSEALETFIADIEAPYHLHSDNAQMERSNKWLEVLRKYNISSSTTEPLHPWQNDAERRIQEYKKGTNRILDRTGAPSTLWFYALMLWVSIMNILADPHHKGRTCSEAAMGYTPDISAYLHHTFYDPIYYYDEAEKFPSTKEQLSWWLGPTTNCGDALTYWILTENNTIISRSTIRPASNPATVNHCHSPPFHDEGGVSHSILMLTQKGLSQQEGTSLSALSSLQLTLQT